MRKPRELTKDECFLIWNIALKASKDKNLDFNKCYTITLLYFLCQYCGFEQRSIPPEYVFSVELLYKNFYGSYIHYINDINYSNDEYAKAIKAAEIALYGGDDPKCLW